MPAEVGTLLLPFLVCLARVSGVVTMAPIPGWKASPREFRAVLAVALTVVLFPVWTTPVRTPYVSSFQWAGFLAAETVIGLLIGTTVSFLSESFALAAQLFGLQAGFSYASTIDPNSEADSGVLQVALQLVGGMVFLGLGLDLAIIRVLASSFERVPAGSWVSDLFQLDRLLLLGTEMWRIALRLAMPIAMLLLLLDIMLALLNRLQSHLQLLSLAFPIKLLATLVILAVVVSYLPDLTRQEARLFFKEVLP